MLRIRNTGAADTPMLEGILPLDFEFDPPGAGEVVFHHVLGSASRTVQDGEGGMSRDFSPVAKPLSPGTAISLVHYVMNGYQHVESYLPFFNMQWQGGGMIGGIGWTGQWRIQAKRGGSRTVALQVGQETTHFILHPGESVRTPSILLVQWGGKDRVLGHNQLRRLLAAHYLPRIDGQVAMPPVAASTGYVLQFEDIANKTGHNPLEVLPTLKETDLGTRFIDQTPALNWVTEENQLDYIHKMPPGIEAYWMDAGWFQGEWPFGVGNPDPDPKRFPRGMKPLGDAAHAKGLKFLLWFEPERVSHGTFIEKQHPDWVLHIPNEERMGGRFNFGNPMALQWMTDLLSRQIGEWGIDIFRNDNNICPLPFWLAADAPDRQGITENHDIEGLYSMWDALLKRHPKLAIDNANWRITGPDLEAMKRSIGSLSRSESCGPGIPHPIWDQVQTAELSLWIPLHANLMHGLAPYSARSTVTTGVGVGLDLRSDYIPRDQLEKMIAQVKELRPFWLGDYYPLTEINFDETAWCGWQFNRQDLGSGFAVFFRRPKSKSAQSRLDTGLRGLDPKAPYEVTFAETYDVKEKRVMTGAELGKLRLEVGSAPASLLVRYRKAKGVFGPGGNQP
jgi:alpha-galactosidase